jgi:uncharacterized OB-fold protein
MDRKLAFIGTPDTNPEMKPYWEGLSAGKFQVRTCTACGKTHWYPRALCPFCFSDKTEWRPSEGNGVIYSFSVMQRAEVPYTIAYVTLDEGPSMMTNIVDCDFSQLKIGQRVKLVLKPTEGGPPMPMFTPA